MYKFHVQMANPYKCECNCSSDQEIDQQKMVNSLLKYNSGLTKYLAKYTSDVNESQNIQTNKQKQLPQKNDSQAKPIKKSIIEEKGLNFGVPDDDKLINKKKQEEEVIQKQYAEQEQQTQKTEKEKEKKKKTNDPQTKNEDYLSKHYKELTGSSRYLSDTGFRKYFGRQCFENYGRNNTNGAGDGIIYGNYLKTHNINPHCGYNMPIDEETFKHALISADPEKYSGYEDAGVRQKHKDEKPIYRHNNEMQQIKREAKKHEDEQMKYSRIKLVSPKNKDQTGRKESPLKEIKENNRRVLQQERGRQETQAIKQTQKQTRYSEQRIVREREREKEREIEMRRQLQVERELQKKKERQGYELERRERVNEKWLNNKESKHKRVEEDRQQYEYRRYNPPIVYEEDRYKQCNCRCSKHITDCEKCREILKSAYLQKGFSNPYITNEILKHGSEKKCRNMNCSKHRC